MPNRLYWTSERLDKLGEVYPSGNKEQIMSMFPEKTWQAIKFRASSSGIHFSRRGTPINQDFFKVWTPEMAYVLGFVTADGALIRSGSKKYPKSSYYLRISSKDKQILDDIAHVMGWQGKISKGRTGKVIDGYIAKTEYYLSIGSREIFGDLVSLRLTERKSFTITPPENIPSDMLSHYCRGVIDGDGTIAPRKEKKKRLAYLTIRMYSPNKSFAEWFNISVAGAVGIPSNVVSWNKTCWGIKYSAHTARLICDWLYSNSTIHLDRKRKFYLLSDEMGRIPFDLV